jgi:hypothetical protein
VLIVGAVRVTEALLSTVELSPAEERSVVRGSGMGSEIACPPAGGCIGVSAQGLDFGQVAHLGGVHQPTQP